jgi:predicted Zn-dependent protease
VEKEKVSGFVREQILAAIRSNVTASSTSPVQRYRILGLLSPKILAMIEEWMAGR